jgi:outer membrane protein assembly factor BamD
MRILKAFLFFGLIVSLVSCGSNGEKQQKSSEQQVYETAQRALDRANWTTAIEALHLLEENFPFGTYAEQAQLELIYANYRAGDYAAVISSADRFIRLHPQHRNVDYAYYMRALASANQAQDSLGSMLGVDQTRRDTGAARESFTYFSQLLNRFPNSVYAPDARKRMVHQRNLLARHEIHVANYYFRRQAYLAAANRGRYVVENFQQTPAVPDGLAVMAQAYYLMDMPELAEDAARVLSLNYPNHPALNEEGEFNYQYSAQSGRRSWWSYLTFGLFDKNTPQEFDTRALYNPSFREDENVEPPRVDS